MLELTETSRSQQLRNSVVLTDSSLNQLDQQLGQHGWSFDYARVKREEGRTVQAQTLDELKGLDETWWIKYLELELKFKHLATNSVSWISFLSPRNRMLSQEIRTYVNSPDYGVSLAVEHEYKTFCDANGEHYAFLSRAGFWYGIVVVEVIWSALWNHFRGPLPSWPGYLLDVIELSTVAMAAVGHRVLFPVVRIRLGSALRKAGQSENFRRQVRVVVWDLAKIVIGALLGFLLGKRH